MGALASRQVIGRYDIYAKIASGGMASVHFGRLLGAAGFSRTVAIKRLHPHLAEDPEFVSAMIDEARMVARIHHPNVVPTLDVVSDGGELLLVMEYVRGESLSRLLKTESARVSGVPLPISSAMVVGALHGLHAAHEATDDRGAPLGIVHRDVSPQNILVGVDGTARVIDFGVAKAAGRLQTTRAGVFKGKMAYVAPEQLAAGEVTRAADVYAMGVVLWETLAGKRLFQADSDAELVVKVLAGAKEPPSVYAPHLSPEFDALVMKALELDPADRFGSAQEMADTLRRVVPPAFPTDLGRWVEQAAREALTDRGAALAEIESSSVVASVRPRPRSSGHARRPHRDGAMHKRVRDATDEVPTVASQPTHAPGTDERRLRGARLASAVGAALVLAAGVAALAWRGGGLLSASTADAHPIPSVLAPQVSTSSPAPQLSADAPAPQPVATVPDPAVSASAAPSLSPVVATTVAAPRPLRPPGTAAKPHPVPKPAGSIRFEQPD